MAVDDFSYKSPGFVGVTHFGYTVIFKKKICETSSFYCEGLHAPLPGWRRQLDVLACCWSLRARECSSVCCPGGCACCRTWLQYIKAVNGQKSRRLSRWQRCCPVIYPHSPSPPPASVLPHKPGETGVQRGLAWTDQHGPPNERPNQPSDGGLQRTPGLSGSGRGRLWVRSRLGGGCRGLLQRYVQQSARHGAGDTGGEIKRTGVQKTDLVSVSGGAGRMLGQDTGQGRMC